MKIVPSSQLLFIHIMYLVVQWFFLWFNFQQRCSSSINFVYIVIKSIDVSRRHCFLKTSYYPIFCWNERVERNNSVTDSLNFWKSFRNVYKVKQYSTPFPQIFHIGVMFLDALYLGCYSVSLRKDMLQKLGMCEFFNLSIHWRDS